MTSVDVVVIGGGIAGAAAAYYAAADRSVLLVEAERTLGHHSTGRSAALFIENYGVAANRPLTRASKAFFDHPPPELEAPPLTHPRGALWLARPDQLDEMAEVIDQANASGANATELTPAEAVERSPMVRGDRLAAALWEPDPFDLDVAAAHQTFVRGLRRRGGEIRTSSAVTGLEADGTGWIVRCGEDSLSAAAVINAAGAWGDAVADLAGLDPIGLTALRRTAFMVGGAEEWSDCPMTLDVGHGFYFKPDGVQLLCSPADETAVTPSDVRPDPLDVALAIERINEATSLDIRSVRSEWAGLRTFSPDRAMVIGAEPTAPSFVWLVGQGGTGIQTAPAAGMLAATEAAGAPPPEPLLAEGLSVEAISPLRFRTPAG